MKVRIGSAEAHPVAAPADLAGIALSREAEARQRATIFALSSAPGRAGVAVFRISGPRADQALQTLIQGSLPGDRRAEIRTLFDKTNDRRLDSALVIRFPAPRSYTGENIVELQTHGGRAVIAAVLEALGRIPGLRPAEPGEFTRRAVEAGRLDLTQAEAVVDLIDAETEAQRRQALRQLDGGLTSLYEGWRARLIRAAAWFEAAIDFPDEEIPPGAVGGSHRQVHDILQEIQSHLADGRRGEILREGFHVAIMGPPNAGKSSLVNAMARRDVAIVSEVAGTTRDIIEVRLDLKGYPVILADMAGIREARDALEAEGVRRAEARARAADFRLLVLDGGAADPLVGLSPEIMAAADLIVWNKADLGIESARPGLRISAKTGEGIALLINELSARAKAALEVETHNPTITRARHRHALEEAVTALAAAQRVVPEKPELAAEDIRLALRAIGRITGRVDLDELLDVVFRDFCIGK